MTRAALIDQLSASYVEMAVLKGARPARVALRHARCSVKSSIEKRLPTWLTQ